jgi:hypothetical protein
MKAIQALKKLGLTPLKMDPATRPGHTVWNNFGHVIIAYHVYYCAAEGLSRSDEMARLVLIYLFQGFAPAESTQRGIKRAPIIRIIHHACQAGKHGYSHESLEKHFAVLLKLFKKKPTLKKFLADGGNGRPPTKYNAAVEKGLRNCGSAGLMGRVAMQTPLQWEQTRNSQKRDCYFALARFALDKPSLRMWLNFDWGTFVICKPSKKRSRCATCLCPTSVRGPGAAF